MIIWKLDICFSAMVDQLLETVFLEEFNLLNGKCTFTYNL